MYAAGAFAYPNVISGEIYVPGRVTDEHAGGQTYSLV